MTRLITVIVAVFALMAVLGGGAHAKISKQTFKSESGKRMTYYVALPDGYDPAKAYPTIIAFPGGGQDNGLARSIVQGFFEAEAATRGYIVIGPAASGKRVYYREGADMFPEFFEHLKSSYKVKDGKFHLSGLSNGGISAFNIAALHPDYVLSIITFPGYVWRRSDERYAALMDKCIVMYAGSRDTGWVSQQNRDVEGFRQRGKEVFAHIFEGDGHVPQSLRGDGAKLLFDGIEQRLGC